jgi:hypothetical protein
MVDVRFKAPKRKDTKQWEKVKFLVDHGFYFQKVYRKEGGAWYRVRYPATLEEAKEFVELYKDQAIVYE